MPDPDQLGDDDKRFMLLHHAPSTADRGHLVCPKDGARTIIGALGDVNVSAWSEPGQARGRKSCPWMRNAARLCYHRHAAAHISNWTRNVAVVVSLPEVLTYSDF